MIPGHAAPIVDAATPAHLRTVLRQRLTKGPVALILLIPPLLAYCWLCRSGTQYSILSTQYWLLFFGVVLAINLPGLTQTGWL